MVDRFLRPVLQALLSVILAIAVAVTVLLFGLQNVVYNEKLYSDIPEDPAFVEGMTAYVLNDLEAECLFYDLPFDTMKNAVTEEWIRELSQEYTAAVYTALCSGNAAEDLTVDPAPYRAVLDIFFASLPEEERPLDDNAAATLSEELAHSTALVMAGGLSDTILNYGHRFVYGDTLLRRVASYAVWALIAVVVLALLSVIPWGGWRRRVYATAGSLFIGSALTFVPLWLLQRHGLVDRLVLGESPLKLYVNGILNGMIDGMTAISLWVFVGALVLLAASVVVMVCHKEETK